MEHADTENSPLRTKPALLARIRTALGGKAAELVYYGEKEGVSTGAAGDLQSATRIAKAMLVSYGMDEEFGIAALSREEESPLSLEINRRVNAVLKEQLAEATNAIKSGKKKIDRLVHALLEKNKLTREEMEKLLGG
jgi:ATP-dependent Zn protease